MTTPTYRAVGIDVRNASLDVVTNGGERLQVANSATGHADLIAWLRAAPPDVIVLEATGRSELGVVIALNEANMTPVVMNPLSIRRFAQSLGRKAKNDLLDAAILAEYGARIQPTPRPIPDATARHIRDLLVRHRQLTERLVMEKNRLQQATPVVRSSINALIAILANEIETTDRLLSAVVHSDEAWSAVVPQLATVPGIGDYLATAIASGLPELGRCTAKEGAALAGLAPNDSGARRGVRFISGGRKHVRTALSLAAQTAIRCGGPLAAHYHRLHAQGKEPKQARVACARRLLGWLTAMVRDGLAWRDLTINRPISA